MTWAENIKLTARVSQQTGDYWCPWHTGYAKTGKYLVIKGRRRFKCAACQEKATKTK